MPSRTGRAASPDGGLSDREGSNAGRGFRYQDAVAGAQAIASWAGDAPSELIIPEGGDDVERRGPAGATLVQVKSRRGHLGPLPLGEAAAHVLALWGRSSRIAGGPIRYELVVEQGVVGCARSGDALPEALARRLSADGRAATLSARTRLLVAPTPREDAIAAVVRHTGCAPLVAELCVARVVARIGDLADGNGRRLPAAYLGLTASEVDAIVSDTLAVTDPDAVEAAIRNGACEPVDFTVPLHDPDFHLGVDVQPGHVVAGLVTERPTARSAVENALATRAVLVAGPSGAGKSALMWESAHALRHTVRWYRIRRSDTRDVPALTRLLRTLRVSSGSPVGFVLDDVGRNGAEGWGALAAELSGIAGALLLGSIREEDLFMLPDRQRQVEIRLEPDDGLAERLWSDLRAQDRTEWPGWREPWRLSNGLTLEYVHILTAGRRFGEVLADQVAARERDAARDLELDVLRITACASAAGAATDVSALADVLGTNDAAISRALRRLLDEHLVRDAGGGRLAGLHQLRSAELLRLTHMVPPPTLSATVLRTIHCVPGADLEALLADAVGRGLCPQLDIVAATAARIISRPSPDALAASLRGLGSGRVRLDVERWLTGAAVAALPRTQVGSAAMFGVSGVPTPDLPVLAPIARAAAELTAIKENPSGDLRQSLFGALPNELLASLIGDVATAEELEPLLATLIGGGWTRAVADALRARGAVGMGGDLCAVAAVLGTLAILDRELASDWADSIGWDGLVGRLPSEVAWSATPSIGDGPESTMVRCNYHHIGHTVQPDPHADVVSLCETMLGLWPAAEIAVSDAVSPNGLVAGTSDLDLVTKRIRRANLPPASVPRWNRQWKEAIALRVATPTYTGYLTEGVEIADGLGPLLERILDRVLRAQTPTPRQLDDLAALHDRATALTPPIQSVFEASGTGEVEANRSVTKFQNILFEGSANIVRRMAALPEGAGALISTLNDLVRDCDRVMREEPWSLLGDPPTASLVRLQCVIVAVRELAGDAHLRSASPVTTWRESARKARAGNALAACAVQARAASERARASTAATLRATLEGDGFEGDLRLVDDPQGVLPWPPYEVVAIVPATDIGEALLGVALAGPRVRAAVDESARVTVAPIIRGVAIPQLAITGGETMLNLPDRSRDLLTRLGVPVLDAPLADLLSDTVANASWLASMDLLGLGVAGRPQEEASARERLEDAFIRAGQMMERRAAELDPALADRLTDHVRSIRSGDIDMASAAHDLLHGEVPADADALAEQGLAVLDAELRAAFAGG